MSVKGTNWIQVERGRTFRQAHQHEDIGLLEEEIGRSGFVGRAAQLYHRNEPNIGRGDHPFRETNVITGKLDVPDEQDPAAPPLPLFHNHLAAVSLSRRREAMPHARRNLGADEVHFVHEGVGTFVTEFGEIPYEVGDFVVIPRAITYQVRPAGERNVFLVVETVEQLLPPDPGPFGRHAPFDPSVLFVPEPRVQPDDGAGYDILVKRGAESGVIRLPHSPFDVAGWKGDYFPYKLNSRDWNPLLSTGVHLPPSAHLFLTTGSVHLVNMVPRPMEPDPRADRVPYFHRNLDYDEISFIHDGSMGELTMPRGLIAHTPQGINHGPAESVRDKQRANWRAGDQLSLHLVMVESTVPFVKDIARPAHA